MTWETSCYRFLIKDSRNIETRRSTTPEKRVILVRGPLRRISGTGYRNDVSWVANRQILPPSLLGPIHPPWLYQIIRIYLTCCLAVAGWREESPSTRMIFVSRTREQIRAISIAYVHELDNNLSRFSEDI
ncbi:hypothetical protein B0H12DRAFT_856547 [Mycena haematopus]|nr:hypothetical protein B0H12DRAFT_856547 [Mycena haematopus]